MKSNDIMQSMVTQSNFKFSAVDVGSLTSSEYTIVNIALDLSGSVTSYYSELVKSVKTIVNACKHSDRAENLMIRFSAFNNSVDEIHGFKTLYSIDVDNYDQTIQNPRGVTSLNDATIDAIESLEQYGKSLTDQEFEANGILFIITDGDDNNSLNSKDDVANRFKKLKYNESLESIQAILVGVNTNDTYFKNHMNEFKDAVDFDEFIEIENATPENLAKLARFVSKSISLQSQALGSGGPSKQIASF